MSSIAPQSVIKSLEVVGEIFKEENIKISVKESVKGGLITGIAALVGGLLGGKSGLIAGIVKALINIIYLNYELRMYIYFDIVILIY